MNGAAGGRVVTMIDAVYANGVFTPVGNPGLAEGARVQLNVMPAAGEPTPGEIAHRQRMAKELEEIYSHQEILNEEDPEYDIERWIEESRMLAGEIPKRVHPQ